MVLLLLCTALSDRAVLAGRPWDSSGLAGLVRAPNHRSGRVTCTANTDDRRAVTRTRRGCRLTIQWKMYDSSVRQLIQREDARGTRATASSWALRLLPEAQGRQVSPSPVAPASHPFLHVYPRATSRDHGGRTDGRTLLPVGSAHARRWSPTGGAHRPIRGADASAVSAGPHWPRPGCANARQWGRSGAVCWPGSSILSSRSPLLMRRRPGRLTRAGSLTMQAAR